ncbi:MAG: hypothetical protein LUG95_02925 [Clostridiales bacterium]|nr:hypothetical protein [Clostridiales bacterium]
MNKEKIFSMLGLARRAGRLAYGHDAVKQSVIKKRACMLIFCSDVSPRLVRDFEYTVQKQNANIPLFKTSLTMEEIYFYAGCRAGVIAVEDENFSNKIISLLIQEENANGN